jgi:hypothetical protein
MTQKEAKEISLEVWRYLAKHPECFSKDVLPDELWEKIHDLTSECPLCELFYIDDFCPGCPLDTAGENCLDRSAYQRWAESALDDTETRRKTATRIVKIISAWKPKEESNA